MLNRNTTCIMLYFYTEVMLLTSKTSIWLLTNVLNALRNVLINASISISVLKTLVQAVRTPVPTCVCPLCWESNVLLELDLTMLFHLRSVGGPIKREQDEINRGDSCSQICRIFISKGEDEKNMIIGLSLPLVHNLFFFLKVILNIRVTLLGSYRCIMLTR